jgi:thiopurine S-methyltransferase
METSFWHERWDENKIGFHESKPNPLLVNNFNKLSLDKGARVFVPLCGKTLDIAWLLAKGYRVAGAELSEKAIEQLFQELGVVPNITDVGNLKLYSAADIDIFVGDILDVSSDILGSVDAVYDRAALVALPEDMRSRYTVHLTEITKKTPQFLICFEYDQSLVQGPPFSINAAEVTKQYGHNYDLTLLESLDVAGGLKGKCAAKEHVWLLNNH